ncbi:MAG: C-terminal binding protein [Candidatus Competibacterales bacterium]
MANTFPETTPGPWRVLIPDAQFRGDAEVERATANAMDAAVEFVVHREREPGKISPDEFAHSHGLMVWHEYPIDAGLIDGLDRCRVIVRAGVGFDHIDLVAAKAKGIPVCNTPDYGTNEVADHAMALWLALRRGITAHHDALRLDSQKAFHPHKSLMDRLWGSTFGIVGLGRIGTATALRAKAFGCRVVAFDPHLPRGWELALGVERLDSLEALLPQCQAVSLHAPLTPKTRHLIDARALAAMDSRAVLINTARGGLVDLDALAAALEGGQIAGAGLDVFPDEPPDPQHPLWQAYQTEAPWTRDRVIFTPHAAWYSPDSRIDARRLATETLLLYLQRGQLRNCVNGFSPPATPGE